LSLSVIIRQEPNPKIKETVMRAISIAAIIVALVAFVGLPASNAHAQNAGPSGKVIETMDSGGYTYIKMDINGQEGWAAVPQTKVKVGQKVTLQPGMVMPKLESKTLNRTFTNIYFSAGIMPE